MLKRQMFGRAHLDLLSRRFVGAPRDGPAQTASEVRNMFWSTEVKSVGPLGGIRIRKKKKSQLDQSPWNTP